MAKPAAADPQLAFVLHRPFAEQVAFFRGKLGKLVPTKRWDDILGQAHDRAFMVAGAAKADLLADLADAVDKAINDGETLQEFRERFGDIVQKHGWQGWTGEKTPEGRAWRTRVIYQTNIATSYAAGRLAQLRDAGFRLWVYRHTPNEHPRLQHLAWDGLTLPADHPFWQTHFPPNGFGCKCRVLGANGIETAKLVGGNPDYTEPPAGWDAIDQDTGEQIGIGKGWGYMPGATSDLVREIERKAAALPPLLADALKEDVASRFRTKLRKAFDDVVASAKADGPDMEYAALLDDSGDQSWIKRGGDGYVQFTADELRQMRDAILVHNHPGGASLSFADIRLAGIHGLRRIYAVSNDGDHIYAATVNDRSIDRLIGRYAQYEGEAHSIFRKKLDRGEITRSEANKWHQHIVNALASIDGIISYRVIGSVPQWVKEIIRELRPA
jgi:hypothetical protein